MDLAGGQEQQRAAPHPIVAEVMHHLSAPLQKHQLKKIVVMRLEPAWIVNYRIGKRGDDDAFPAQRLPTNLAHREGRNRLPAHGGDSDRKPADRPRLNSLETNFNSPVALACSWPHQNAVIYGAGGGIGGAVARAFAREGRRSSWPVAPSQSSIFPREIYRAPRRWAERVFPNLTEESHAFGASR